MKDLSESRILIVDDAKVNVDLLVEALRGEYKLSVALSGESALRIIEKAPPDLVHSTSPPRLSTASPSGLRRLPRSLRSSSAIPIASMLHAVPPWPAVARIHGCRWGGGRDQ